jgi:hypothetical protein
MDAIDYARLVFLVVILFISLVIKQNRQSGISKLILTFIGIAVLSELLPLFTSDYNLIHLSVISVCQLGLIATALYYETSKFKVPLAILAGGTLFFVFLLISDWSSYSLITEGIQPVGEYPIGIHQFFDLLSVVNLGLIVLMFLWLLHLVKMTNYDPIDLNKKYIFIFAFLIYAGGSFFMVAFSRFIIPSLEEWFSLWSLIYIPIWFIFYLLLFAGLIWRPTRS